MHLLPASSYQRLLSRNSTGLPQQLPAFETAAYSVARAQSSSSVRSLRLFQLSPTIFGSDVLVLRVVSLAQLADSGRSSLLLQQRLLPLDSSPISRHGSSRPEQHR